MTNTQDMSEWMAEEREKKFPKLNRSVYQKTSEEDEFYNCFAYAVGDRTKRWEPPVQEGIEEPDFYWPPGVPIDPKLDSLVKAFEFCQFEVCPNDALETGYEKVALYAYPDGIMAHAAKQLDNGKWSSKLGDWEDIMHDTCAELEAAEGESAYGFVKLYMRRPIEN